MNLSANRPCRHFQIRLLPSDSPLESGFVEQSWLLTEGFIYIEKTLRGRYKPVVLSRIPSDGTELVVPYIAVFYLLFSLVESQWNHQWWAQAHTGNRQPEGENDGGITYLVVPFRIPHHPLAENLHPFLDFCRIQFVFLQFLILQSVC